MSADDLFCEMSKKYRVLCFLDIADIVISHKKIFELFSEIRKDIFLPDERLVLYSSENLDQIVLDHITRAAAKVDISNFFILICNSHDISKKLKKANDKYGYDKNLICNEIINLKKTKLLNSSNLYDFKTMCASPFSQIQVDKNGDSRPCCKFNGTLGNLKNENTQSMFLNKNFSNVRKKMKNGIKIPECAVCWEHELSGTKSLRQLLLDKYEEKLNYGWLDNLEIRDLTITPSNICNFKCRICDYGSSSTIAAEKIQNSKSTSEIHEIKKYLKEISIKNNKNFLIDSINNVSEYLENLHILGGEPFMHPQLEGVIDTLIDNSTANKITLEFNSNGSIFPKNLIEKFQKFKSVEILLSIDDIGKRFEIQRGGKWEVVLENIKKFNEIKSEKIFIKIATTVNIQNILYLDEIYNFFHNCGIDILWWYLEDPWYYCIDYMNKDTQDAVIKKYRKHEDKELRNIACRVASNSPFYNKDFLEACKYYDTMRNQKFSVAHKELIKLMTNEQ